MIINILFIILNIIFYFFIIKEDFKERKIRNVFLKRYIYFIILYKCIDIYYFPIKINLMVILYYFCCILIPYLFYIMKLWGAGDSKLLTLLLINLPNNILEKYGIIYIVKYLNAIFIVAFSIYAIQGICEIFKNKMKIVEKGEVFELLKTTTFFLLFLNIIFNVINNFLNIQNIYIEILFNFLIVLFLKRIYDRLTNRLKVISIFILLIFNVKFKISNLLFKYIYVFGIFLFRKVIGKSERKKIVVENLKVGDIISNETIKKFSISRVQNLPRLSEGNVYKIKYIEELESIKRWKKSKYGEEYVVIEKIVPFSLYICLSYLFLILYFTYTV